MDDEPKPKRRSALRHALGGLALVVLLISNAVLLEMAGITEWSRWSRHVRSTFGGGREGMRKQVFCGMTRKEVEARIGGASGEVFMTVSVGIVPGGRGPVRESTYPWPFAKVSYPEYGFTIVYHCKTYFYDTDSWTVSAVEDLD